MGALMDKLAAEKKAAEGILAKGEDSMTEDDVKELKSHMETAKSLSDRISAIQDATRSMDSLVTVGERRKSTDESKPGSLGEFVVGHIGDRLREIKGVNGASVSAPEYFAKANTDTQVTGGPSGALGPLLTDVDRNIVTGYRRPTVTGLFGQGTMSGSAITYFVEGDKEGDFTTVAEAGTKPQLHYADPTPVTDALSKIAGFIKVSDEMTEDLDFLVSEINGRLLYDLSIAEETQVLSGNGTSPNLTGLLNRAGIQTYTADSTAGDAAALLHARTLIQNETGLSPDAIVINPADYEVLRLSKDANEQYYAGGPFAGAYGQGGIVLDPPLWAMNTVISPAVAEGTALVGAFQQGGTVYRKGGVRVESTNSNASDFISNLVTIRAEERIALAVRRPKAFVKVTLTTTSV